MKKVKTGNSLFRNKNLFSTFALIMYIVLLTSVVVYRVDHLTREQCYQLLSSSTNEACIRLENNFKSDRSSLRMLARVIANESDLTSDEVNHFLTAYDISSITSDVAILTPENTVVRMRGGNVENNTVIDFDTESAPGEHISGLQPRINGADPPVIRSFVPIKNSGKITGLLFLEMNPGAIASAWAPEIYGRKASFCVADRATGNMIINGWNTSITNVSQLPAPELAENIMGGRTGFVQIDADEKDDDYFVSYMPMEIEDWEIMVIVAKSEVFSSANDIESFLQIFIIAVAVSLACYLGWVVYTNRLAIAATEKQANIDVLTGLQNRNRYESFCRTLDDRIGDFACIYIDANGLHEINNSKGHLAGDQMLRFIADTLKIAFGEDMVYRVGGDEFVVFQRSKSEKELSEALKKVHSEVEKNDYHIASGICVHNDEHSVNDMIKTAEGRMYEEKKRYYESRGQQVRNALSD